VHLIFLFLRHNQMQIGTIGIVPSSSFSLLFPLRKFRRPTNVISYHPINVSSFTRHCYYLQTSKIPLIPSLLLLPLLHVKCFLKFYIFILTSLTTRAVNPEMKSVLSGVNCMFKSTFFYVLLPSSW
jgi:hypothetical protein